MIRRLAIAATLALAACAGEPAADYPPISFMAKPQLRLDVAQIVIEPAVPPMADPTTPRYLVETPFQAVQDWARQRLVAAGDTGGTAVVVVERADARAVGLPTRGGIGGMFTDEQSVKYVMTIAVRIELHASGTRESTSGTARATVERSVTAPESASGEDRRQTLYRLLDATMSDFDVRMQQEIENHLGAFLMH